MSEFLKAFEDFSPSFKSASFTIDEALQNKPAAAAGGATAKPA
jgi:hypothetical protein